MHVQEGWRFYSHPGPWKCQCERGWMFLFQCGPAINRWLVQDVAPPPLSRQLRYAPAPLWPWQAATEKFEGWNFSHTCLVDNFLEGQDGKTDSIASTVPLNWRWLSVRLLLKSNRGRQRGKQEATLTQSVYSDLKRNSTRTRWQFSIENSRKENLLPPCCSKMDPSRDFVCSTTTCHQAWAGTHCKVKPNNSNATAWLQLQ